MTDLDDSARAIEDLAALQLRQPYAIIAFGGWIDASFAATNAVRYLVDRLGARQVAELDPEPYYSFTDTRPRAVLRGAGEREVRWRRGRWHAARMPEDAAHDLVLFIAPEPNLHWRRFTNVLLDVLQQLDVQALVTLGAVLAPTHHRARVPLRGWATTDEWRAALRRRGVIRSTYEGPTGISTVLLVSARERGLPAMSVSASTPSYLGSIANPRTSLELLRAVADLYALRLPLVDLERAMRSFNEQVEQFLSSQPELRAEVERLAQLAEEEEPEPPAAELAVPEDPAVGELPTSGEVLRDLEDFLKNLRQGQGDS